MFEQVSVANSRSSGRASLILFITSLFFFYEFGLNNIFNALEADIAREYHLSGTMIGFVSSLYFYANIIFLLPAGILLDRFSARKLISTAMFICSIGVLMVALCHHLGLLILARFMMGIGGGFCFIGCVRVAINWFDAPQMARVTGVIVTMGMLGGFMVQAPMAIMIHLIGWRPALLVVSLIGFIIMFLIWAIVRDVPNGLEDRNHMRKQHLNQLGVWKSLGLALGKAQNWWCGLYTGAINLPIFMLGALWGIPYLTRVHNLSATEAATISGMLYIGTMIGSILAGWISDQMGRRKLPMIIGAVLAIILAYIIIDMQSSNYQLLLLLFFLLGLITSTQVISYPTVGESNSVMVTSTATSIISIFCLGGGAIVQPLFGQLISKGWDGTMQNGVPLYSVNSYQFAMNILPITFIIALIAACFIKETYCRRFDSNKQ